VLNHHSFYSFKHGLLSPAEWIEWAQEQGEDTLALTDINTSAAAIEFIRLAKDAGIKPVVGIDFHRGVNRCFIALATNEAAFAEINHYLSGKQMQDLEIEEEAPLEEAYIIYPFDRVPKRNLRENEYIGLQPRELTKLRFSVYKNKTAKMVILHPNSFRHKADYNTHRLLRSIGQNCLLSKLEPEQQAPAQWGLINSRKLKEIFSEYPEIIANSERLLADCNLEFEFKNYSKSLNRQFYTDSLTGDRELIRSLCYNGLEYRYPIASSEVHQRLEKELDIIEKRGYYSYFLINWDIVNYARRKNYFYVGRGSGANSLVAYLLRITDVDPIALDLYFERFINLSRKQPPDFDIDFSWRDRGDITRYIFERFPKACLLGSYTTFKYRAIVRELGKVMGLPSRDIDELSNARKRDGGNWDDMQKLVLRYGKRIESFPHHLTIHSSGILIPEKEIYHYGSTFLPPKGFATTHFDMYTAEDIGLHKFDILGQRGLAKIKEAVQLVKATRPEAKDLDIHQVGPFYEDKKIKSLLRQGQTMACFYVESPAMRALLRKLSADTYLGLVAASSIIRPGVSASGMMGEYIKRYREPERRKYIHPKIGEILQETFGIMVYQEDVLKVAHYFAGLTLEEADVLRRGMSWKFRERNEFDSIKDKFFENCLTKGYGERVTTEVWRQIESFGNYAFAKGHSASYAVESYQSLYLKAHYPLEYLVATINNGGGFYSIETYLNEARLEGGTVEAPCVNRSEMEAVLLTKHLFLGLMMLKDLEERVAMAILRERHINGPFTNLNEFLERIEISLEQTILLIRINAFRALEEDKKKLLWEAHFILGSAKKSAPVNELFRNTRQKLELPELESGQYEQAVDEIELLGFPLLSPFALVANLPEGTLAAKDLRQHIGAEIRLCGYLIHIKNVTTRGQKAQHMMFGTFLDQAGHFIDTVHFPPVAKQHPFKGKGIYLIVGKVIAEYDFVSLEAKYIERLPYVNFEHA
jgi:DNA-directed DNA polymerase III PolC